MFSSTDPMLNSLDDPVLDNNPFTPKSSKQPVSSVHLWREDWKPGPYPKTPEERAASAKKYGLRPEDYEPYPDDGDGLGDYPNLPLVGTAAKSDYEIYDMPHLKRNYGEPVPLHWDMLTPERWNPNADQNPPYSMQWCMFLGVSGFFAIIAWLTWNLRFYPPATPKQYPFNELHLQKGGDPAKEPRIKHYTFEPAD